MNNILNDIIIDSGQLENQNRQFIEVIEPNINEELKDLISCPHNGEIIGNDFSPELSCPLTTPATRSAPLVPFIVNNGRRKWMKFKNIVKSCKMMNDIKLNDQTDWALEVLCRVGLCLCSDDDHLKFYGAVHFQNNLNKKHNILFNQTQLKAKTPLIDQKHLPTQYNPIITNPNELKSEASSFKFENASITKAKLEEQMEAEAEAVKSEEPSTTKAKKGFKQKKPMNLSIDLPKQNVRDLNDEKFILPHPKLETASFLHTPSIFTPSIPRSSSDEDIFVFKSTRMSRVENTSFNEMNFKFGDSSLTEPDIKKPSIGETNMKPKLNKTNKLRIVETLLEEEPTINELNNGHNTPSLMMDLNGKLEFILKEIRNLHEKMDELRSDLPKIIESALLNR